MQYRITVKCKRDSKIQILTVNSIDEIDKHKFSIIGIKPLGLETTEVKIENNKRKYYSMEEEKKCFMLYKKGYTDKDLRELAKEINRTFDSVKMKMQNIKAIITNEAKGLNHVSELTVDTILKYRGL